MEAIGSLLTVIGTMAFWVSFVSVFRPLKRIGLPTRKRSTLALLLSCAVITTGAALSPDEPEHVVDQAVQEATSRVEDTSEPAPQPAAPAKASQESPAPTEPEQQPVSSSAGAPGSRLIDGESNFGCRTRDYFSKLVDYAVQGDREAWSRALAQGALSGECVLFKADEPVFITDTALFSGLVKVRRKGKLTEYWTDIESVTR